MPFLLILLLTLACLPETWSRPGQWIGAPWQSVLLVAMGCVLMIAIALRVAAKTSWLLAREPDEMQLVVRRYQRGRRWHVAALFVLYLLTLYVFGYGWAVHRLWTWNGLLMPGSDLLVLAPFFGVIILSWAIFYRAERDLYRASRKPREPDDDVSDPFGGKRWAYVWFQARQNLVLTIPPLGLLLIQKELRRFVPAWRRLCEENGELVVIALTLTVFLTMPWLLRWLMGLKPLPEGPLRERLLRAAKRVGFRFSNLLLWRTRGRIANAMVVGVAPFLRYVLLSDRLIDRLNEDEIEAVLGHEIGHVKHHHVAFYFVFLFSSIWIFGLLLSSLFPNLNELAAFRDHQDLLVLPTVAFLSAYVFLIFGFLSRRCERQADIYGCRVASCGDGNCQGHEDGRELAPHAIGLCQTGIRTFCSALEKVAILNGISAERPGFLSSWQHSTIARRIDFLESLPENPQNEASFQWRVFALKCGLIATLGLLFLIEVL